MSELVAQEKELALKTSIENPAMRQFLRTGDLSGLQPAHQDQILVKMCAHYGLDPVLRPFIMIALNGKTVWYATKAATDQLACQKNLTRKLQPVVIDKDLQIASQTCEISDANGRTETATAHVGLSKFERDEKTRQVNRVMLGGEELANALMRLETKAKRRATMAWFGIQNESEDPSIESASTLASAQHIAEATAPQLPEANPFENPEQPEQPKKRGRPSRAEVEAKALANPAPAPVVEAEKISHKTQVEIMQGIPTPEQVKAEFDKVAAERAKQAETKAEANPFDMPAPTTYWEKMKQQNPQGYADFNPETSGRIAGEPIEEFNARFKAAPVNIQDPALGRAIGEQIAAEFAAPMGNAPARVKYDRTLTEHKAEMMKALVDAGINMQIPADVNIAAAISKAAHDNFELFEGTRLLPDFAKVVQNEVHKMRGQPTSLSAL